MTVHEVQMHGLSEALKAMKKVPARLQKNALRAATRKVAANARGMARAWAPKDSGNLIKNIVSRGARGTRTLVRALVIVRTERGVGTERVTANFPGGRSVTLNRGQENDAFYWRFIEYGTRYVAARPFLTPALEIARRTADVVMAAAVRKNFEKALARLNKKGKR